MARKKTAWSDNPKTCGECAHGKPINEHWNTALDGTLICVRCPYSKRAQIRNEKQCENFESK